MKQLSLPSFLCVHYVSAFTCLRLQVLSGTEVWACSMLGCFVGYQGIRMWGRCNCLLMGTHALGLVFPAAHVRCWGMKAPWHPLLTLQPCSETCDLLPHPVFACRQVPKPRAPASTLGLSVAGQPACPVLHGSGLAVATGAS